MNNILLPNPNFTLSSPLTPSEIIEELDKKINSEPEYMKIVVMSIKGFSLSHSDDSFFLHKLPLARHEIKQVTGKFSKKNENTEIQLTVQFKKISELFVWIWFAIFIIALLVSFVISETTLLIYNFLNYTKIAFFAFPIVLGNCYFKSHFLKEELSKILKAKKMHQN